MSDSDQEIPSGRSAPNLEDARDKAQGLCSLILMLLDCRSDSPDANADLAVFQAALEQLREAIGPAADSVRQVMPSLNDAAGGIVKACGVPARNAHQVAVELACNVGQRLVDAAYDELGIAVGSLYDFDLDAIGEEELEVYCRALRPVDMAKVKVLQLMIEEESEKARRAVPGEEVADRSLLDDSAQTADGRSDLARQGVAPRNRKFLEWHEAEGEGTFGSPKTIVNKWNGMNQKERAAICPRSVGRVTLDVVAKGIQRAREARDGKLEKPKRSQDK